jgi:hypothetical protein
MLTIDRLRLHLPPGYRHRAASIGRCLAAELAGMPLRRNVQLERLHLPPVDIAPGAGDGQIAQRMAAAVQGRIERVRR